MAGTSPFGSKESIKKGDPRTVLKSLFYTVTRKEKGFQKKKHCACAGFLFKKMQSDLELVVYCRRVCSHAADSRACTLAADILIDVSPIMKQTMQRHVEQFIERHGGWRSTPWWTDFPAIEDERMGLYTSWMRNEPRHVLSHVNDADFIELARQQAPCMTRAAEKFMAWDPEGVPIYRTLCARPLYRIPSWAKDASNAAR